MKGRGLEGRGLDATSGSGSVSVELQQQLQVSGGLCRNRCADRSGSPPPCGPEPPSDSPQIRGAPRPPFPPAGQRVPVRDALWVLRSLMPQRAPAAAEEMPLSSACRRERADAAERLRSVRERLDAVMFGLGELENLRQRQQVLIRTALEKPEDREARLSPEENILVLRRQLSLLRRREAVLMGPLQELDLHINQLRLDGQTPSDQLEMDSRPSSGFYELSDGASGSLSTSSHSVFSECLCSMTDTDGAPTSTDASQEELADCEEFVQGLSDASSSSGVVCSSLSSAHLPPPEAEISTTSHSDPPASNSSLVFRYPSPLRTNAAQSPAFLQGGGRDAADGLKAETYSALKSSSLKHLDGYIYSLLQRRTQPIRSSRPRTSISTDPTKSVLRQPSLCAKQVSGFEVLKGSEEKVCRSAEGVSRSSPPKSQGEEVVDEMKKS
ncbi:Dapper-like protein 1 [Oryzias melastigma]|uniref:Dapper-like protein 1 n=1 Tax=Oryzias melastigma TaxID=30732 RepID=A0A834FAS9_ORYME|nr:Dapper-like protein 1 [Oryzias melastigma]